MKLSKSKFTFFFLLLSMVFFISSCLKIEDIPFEIPSTKPALFINSQEVALDFERKLALFPVPGTKEDFIGILSLKNAINGSLEGQEINNSLSFTFSDIKDSEWEITIQASNSQYYKFILEFSLLPVIQINHEGEIQDDPKILANIKINDPASNIDFQSICGIEIRGGISVFYPKKSLGIELWDDESGNTNKNASLLGLRNDDDWILDAMYVDKSNMRNRVNFELWEQIIKHRTVIADHNNTYIKGKFIELFINNEYQGIYCLNERIDAKQLKINDVANESDVPIYKAEDWSMATQFRAVEDTLGSFDIWMGWEQKHPKPESESYWWPLYSTIDFIANSSDTDFANKIYSHITKESLIDYYILLNITKALDNVGKNIILSRNSKDNPFYICPWDLDLTYGLFWDESKINYSDIISNNIYNRLFELNPEDFCAELKSRWNELAIDIVNYENISSLFEEYESLFYESGAFTREIEKWPESVDVNEIEFIKDWTENRLEYLNNHFNNLN